MQVKPPTSYRWWRWMAALALIAGLVAGCSETGPVFPTSERLDDWVSDPAARDPLSDRAPEVIGKTVRFHLAPGERRSALVAGGKWGVQETYLVGFDIRIEGGTLPAHPMTVSRFVRRGTRETAIATVALDPRRGVTVMGQSCIPPGELGRWHTVETRIRLSDLDHGFIEVFCDRRPVWAANAMRTTQPPICRRAEGCTRPVPRPVQFEWQVGPVLASRASRAVSILMRRVFYHRLFVIPNRVQSE